MALNRFRFTTIDGRPIDPTQTLSGLFTQRGQRCWSTKSTNIHTLRRSAASMMIDNGTHLKVVSDVPRTRFNRDHCRHHGHLYPTQVRDAMDALSDALDHPDFTGRITFVACI